MRIGRSIFAAAFVGGTLAMTPVVTPAQHVIISEEIAWQGDPSGDMDSPHERYPKKIEDDSSLAPGVPGVTEENTVYTSSEAARMAEEALAENGYDPGSIDGVVDLETRHAIRQFQEDNALVVTGNLDRDTAFLLDIPFAESA